MHLSQLVALVAVVGAWSHDIDSASEASALLQATTAILVDSDAELEVDTDKSSSMLIHDSAQTQTKTDARTKVGTGTKTAYLVKLRKLNKTMKNIQCQAQKNAACWAGFSSCAHTLGECLNQAGSVVGLNQAGSVVGSLLQVANSTQDVVNWAESYAPTWLHTAQTLQEESNLMQQIGGQQQLELEVAALQELIQKLSTEAEQDELQLEETYTECTQLGLAGVQLSQFTPLCDPLKSMSETMQGHVSQAQMDKLLLQQLYDRVRMHPELALIEGAHVTAITESDELSSEAISTLMNLLNHESTIMDQIAAECVNLGPQVKTIADNIPEGTHCVNLPEVQAAYESIMAAGEGC